MKFVHWVFVRSWWVIVFILICAILYERGMAKKADQFQQLREQLISLQLEKQQALHKQSALQLQVNSQSDPSWIELTLMKGLGVCPEGQQKNLFLYKNRELTSPKTSHPFNKPCYHLYTNINFFFCCKTAD